MNTLPNAGTATHKFFHEAKVKFKMTMDFTGEKLVAVQYVSSGDRTTMSVAQFQETFNIDRKAK